MRIFRHADSPTRPADASSFVGPARTTLLASSDEGESVHVYRVEFQDGARTNWHTHSGPQWLFVVEGRIRIQSWGGDAQEASEGDAIVIPPGEKHWHGAAPGGRGVHIAVNVNAKTEWLEPVMDDEYGSRLGA
jgi:quercetin dioxygenase-like cupin family protein